MVTTLTLPSSALGFTLDSNNQYIISVTLVMKEIIKMVASLNSSVSLYLRHHNIKYKYIFYINGTAWKSSNGYINLTNTDVSFSNENISGYLSSSSLKQTLSCTVEVSHPQFFCKLNSENYTFVTINKKPQELKAKNASTGQYETIGLSFSNLSSSEKSGIDSVKWPLFNTENSSQQFVIPIGSASYTRRNGSIRAERFGGSAGQYFNLDTNPNSNKDYRANNGTEYRYVDSFTPTFRYYETYSYVKTHYYYTASYIEWVTPSAATPTLTTGENETGRYTSYSFDGWHKDYDFRIDYFIEERIYAPNEYSVDLFAKPAPNLDDLPDSAFGLSYYYPYRSTPWAKVLGKDFKVSYTYATKYEHYTYWPDCKYFVTSGSIYLYGTERYSDEIIFDRWKFIYGNLSYYYCVDIGYDELEKQTHYSYREGDAGIGEIPDTYILRYYSGLIFEYREYTGEKYVYYEGALYATEIRYRGYYKTGRAHSVYEEWWAVYKNKYLSYDWHLYNDYNIKSESITGRLWGNEYEYKAWWDYDTRTNWYIDTAYNEIKYYNNYQIAITNDTDTYRTS